MRIVKIGHKNDLTTITQHEEKNGEARETVLKCDELPRPEFLAALDELGESMMDLLECPEKWYEHFKTTSVSINYEEEDGRRGLVVTLYIPLNKFNGGITINTPHMREQVKGSSGGGSFIPPKAIEQLDRLLEQAEKYYNGNRAQRKLPLKDQEEEGAEE